MKTIPIIIKEVTYHIIVDDEDFIWLAAFPWSGFINSSGQVYATTRFQGSSVLMHRMILRKYESDGIVVDHEDRNSLNNQKDNLRLVTQSINLQNSSKVINAKGVRFDATRNKWLAQGRKIDGTKVNLGRYDNYQAAFNAYERFKLEKLQQLNS